LSLNRKTHHNSHLQNAWYKYGKDNFLFEIIRNDIWNILELRKVESNYINEYKSIDRKFGYNLTFGGEGGAFFLSEESKKKIGDANRGRKMPKDAIEKTRQANLGRPLSDEHKKKLSNILSGRKNPFYGRKHCFETIQKIINSNIKRKGEKRTQETKNKISESLQNYKRTKEHQQNLNLSLLKYQYYFSINGVEIKVNSIRKFCEDHNIRYDYFRQRMSKKKIYRGIIFLRKEKI
jgi:hypothetical protein